MSYLASIVAVFGVLVIATKMHNNDGTNGAPIITTSCVAKYDAFDGPDCICVLRYIVQRRIGYRHMAA